MPSLIGKGKRQVFSAGGSRYNWMSWDKMCSTKEIGGMGFRKLRDFNLALLGKQEWDLIANPTSLIVRLLKKKYFHNCSAQLGFAPSFT